MAARSRSYFLTPVFPFTEDWSGAPGSTNQLIRFGVWSAWRDTPQEGMRRSATFTILTPRFLIRSCLTRYETPCESRSLLFRGCSGAINRYRAGAG